MNFSLHQLRVLKAVYEIGNITKAADYLCMTQPAVSNVIKKLEQQFNNQLLFRSKKRVQLTNIGQLLLQFYQTIEDAYEDLTNDINLAQQGLSGKLRLGCVTTGKYLLPDLLHDFKLNYPHIDLDIDIVNKQMLINKLQDKQVDCAIMSHPPMTFAVNIAKLMRDKLVVIAAIDEFKDFNTITLSDLRSKNWLIRENGSGTRMSMLACFEKFNFQPQKTMQVNDTESIKQLVIAGHGISMVPEKSLAAELKANRLHIITVDNFYYEHNWYLVTLPKSHNQVLMDHFVKCVSQNNIFKLNV